MILEGKVRKKGLLCFEVGGKPVTTGNSVLFFSLREAAKRGFRVRLEGVMETVLFKRQFVPARFV